MSSPKHRLSFAVAAAALALALPAPAEEVVFFDASRAGKDAWSAHGASVSDGPDGGALITETSPTNTSGAAFVTEHFPYVPSGRVVFRVSEVLRGTYTLQVLAFNNYAHFQTVTVVNHATEPGLHEFAVSLLQLPEATQTILFKVWVDGAEGAGCVVRELRYADEIPSSGAVLDERFSDVSAWVAESNRVSASAATGEAPARLGLLAGASYGSCGSTNTYSRALSGEVLWHIPSMTKSTAATLQFDTFTADGVFAGALDVIKDVPAGYHAARLDGLAWPEGAASYSPKIWISAKGEGAMDPGRLLIFRR